MNDISNTANHGGIAHCHCFLALSLGTRLREGGPRIKEFVLFVSLNQTSGKFLCNRLPNSFVVWRGYFLENEGDPCLFAVDNSSLARDSSRGSSTAGREPRL